MLAILLMLLMLVIGNCSSNTSKDVSAKSESKNSEVIAASVVGGRLFPYGRSGDKPTMIISKFSNDKIYGYDLHNPIKVGGDSKGEGSINERRVLKSLYGFDGKIIEYKRLGSCCPFKTQHALHGIGFLDKYSITYKGLEKTNYSFLICMIMKSQKFHVGSVLGLKSTEVV